MKRSVKISLVLFTLLFLAAISLAVVARNQALDLVYFPLELRKTISQTPADLGLQYQDIELRSVDGNLLHAWQIPSQNGVCIILQHGFKSDRTELLEEAAILAKHGYGALLTSVRSHDLSEGELIAFGINEMPDLDAWVKFLQAQDDIESIGMLGNSLGGSLVIQYAAQHDSVKAVVAHSAFSSMRDTINTSVRYFTDLPAFPFASMIGFWAEQEIAGDIDDIDAKKWIADISPRPVLILHSLSDIAISSQSGRLLYDAATNPKELWQVDGVDHASFDTQMAEEFERRVVGFFNQHLLTD